MYAVFIRADIRSIARTLGRHRLCQHDIPQLSPVIAEQAHIRPVVGKAHAGNGVAASIVFVDKGQRLRFANGRLGSDHRAERRIVRPVIGRIVDIQLLCKGSNLGDGIPVIAVIAAQVVELAGRADTDGLLRPFSQ